MHILVIEDNAEDAFLILQAITTADCQAFVCRNVTEARSYLEGTGLFFDRRKYPLPEALIADLKVGGDSGLEFIRWVRAQPQFEQLPAFILSGSLSKDDIVQAQNLGVLRVMQKPQEFRTLERTLAQLTNELMSRV
jgi:DNA-binding response OmpR family regulator